MMAITVKQSFKEFASNLELTDRQQAIVANCRKNVADAIAAELSLNDERSKVIGSWDRHTLTRYLSEGDIDLMIILHYGNNKQWKTSEGTSKALASFKQILQSKYPKTTMSIDTNCVTLKLSEFRLDVVPAFKHEQGYYTIPDTSRGKWIPTDPFTYAGLMTKTNSNMGDTFKPLIKMVKGWNREVGWPIRSFHLETMMYNHYKTYSQAYTYSSTLKIFFGHLPGYLDRYCYDPVTHDSVDDYLSTGDLLRSVIVKAERAATLSSKAFSFEETNPEQSIRTWKTLLGEFFPVYG
jgi:hypothetical protein